MKILGILASFEFVPPNWEYSHSVLTENRLCRSCIPIIGTGESPPSCTSHGAHRIWKENWRMEARYESPFLPYEACPLISKSLDLLNQFSNSAVSNSLRPHELQHTRLPCPSPILGVCSNSCPPSQWCHPIVSPSVISFSCPQSYPASGSFPMSWLFASGGPIIGASASIFPMNILDWFPLGWTGWIALHSKGLSKVFSNTTVQKHQFFNAQLSLWSNSHIHTWLLEKT